MIVCVMPAFNESEGIQDFIKEISEYCQPLISHFVVIDDCSTDDTEEVLNDLACSGLPLTVIRNPVNLGHGPSTLRALSQGLEMRPKLVLAIDGDGQFIGSDVRRVIDTMRESNCDIVEGNRTMRLHEPWFRKFVTSTSRYLVFLKARSLPDDANTPLRLYKAEVLGVLLQGIPADCRIPNLYISVLSRVLPTRICSVDVTSRIRRGKTSSGTTWGSPRRWLPTQRFVSFCWRATRDFLRMRHLQAP